MTKPVAKSKRPKWSAVTNFWAAVIITAIATALTLALVKKDIWIELDIVVTALSVVSFLYFFIILFHGIRFDKSERYTPVWRELNLTPWFESGGLDSGGIFTEVR